MAEPISLLQFGMMSAVGTRNLVLDALAPPGKYD